MEAIDTIRINFNADTLTTMNLCLAFIMFGVALDMTIADFKRIATYPKAVIVGLSSQLIILPILTVLLIYIWQPIASMALGLLLVAACPGGNISNFAVHFSKGNTALSITMTSIVTLGAIVITPVTFALWSKLVPSTLPLLADIQVGIWDMVKIILQLILIPLALGMFVGHKFPSFTAQAKKPIKLLSLILFISFIVFALAANYSNILKYLHLVLLLVIVHNIIALLAGYYWAKWNGLELPERKAICLETGIQNAGLGLVLIFNFFEHLGGMMIVAAFWGVWDLVSSFLISLYWSRQKV